MLRNSGVRACSLVPPRLASSLFLLVSFFILLLAITSCGGNSKKSPSNVGGGYTLLASGGTLNTGSGAYGLAVLVTLRNGNGIGPGGAAGWQIKITGPGINSPLVVNYDDASVGSYSTWWWEQIDPLSGTYTATATDGTTTLTYNFSINTANLPLSQPGLNKTGSTVWWNPVTGAGGYYYEVTDGTGGVEASDYIPSDSLVSQYSFTMPSLPADGSYLVSVYALTKDRIALGNDPSASPSLPSQENDSLSTIDFVQNGTGSGYALDAVGGVLYEDSVYTAGTGTVDYYGLVIWLSLLTTTTPATPPAADWNITVTGPNIDPNYPITFTYPKTDSHYIYWDYGTTPVYPGTYTVSAVVSGGTTSVTQFFTVPSPAAQLPVATGIIATALNGGGASVSWSAVTGAASYYVNLWTDVWNAAKSQWEYTEIAGSWVTGTSATFPSNTLTKGVSYDVYVTACELDMTDMKTVPVPVSPGSQVNMSENTNTLPYITITGN